MSDTSQSPAQSLKKGLACLNCRRKKVRCDGQRPICSPCNKLISKMPATRCEYADHSSARVTHLQEENSSLKQALGEMNQLVHPPPKALVEYLPRDIGGSDLLPSIEVMEGLLQSFLLQAPEFGLFFDSSRIDILQYCPVCRHAIFLWAVHLDGPSSPWAPAEPILLSRTLAFMTTGILPDCGEHEIVCAIQGNILLATYYFQSGRSMEGRSHLGAASSFIYELGLHRIGAKTDPKSRPVVGYVDTLGPSPRKIFEAPERIRCLWTFLTLNHIWCGLDDVPGLFDIEGDCPITTPWPDETVADGEETVTNFLATVPDAAYSANALLAKSALLFCKASSVSRRYRPGMSAVASASLFSAFISLDALIENFAMSLTFEPGSPVHQVILIRTLASAATIKLHQRYSHSSPTSQKKCVMASQAIASYTMYIDFHQYNRIPDRALWKLWVIACEILVQCIRDQQAQSEVESLADSVNNLLSSIGQDTRCEKARQRYSILQSEFAAALAGPRLIGSTSAS